MSDSKLVLAPFHNVEVRYKARLNDQLALVKAIEAHRAKMKLGQKFTLAGMAGMVLATPPWMLWVAYNLYTTYDSSYGGGFDLSFMTGQLCVGMGATVVAVIGSLWVASLNWPNDLAEIPKWYIGLAAGVISLCLLITILPIFPLLLWPLLIGALVYFSTYPKLGQSIEVGHSTESVENLMQDNRYEEYRSFIALQATWNEYAQLLNRLRLKLEYNQFDEATALTVRKALEAMRADERFVQDRCSYLDLIAEEGDLGSRTARASLGADLVHDLSGRMEDMRRRVKELQEFELNVVAALEVETAGRVR